MAANTTPVKLATPASHSERLTQTDAIAAIKKSKARPLMMETGTAVDMSDRIRKLGNKKITIVVLS